MSTGDRQSIGPYALHEVLGEGGMGTVYRAIQTEPVRREVALKIIKAGMDTREVVARFQSERQALAVMDHTSIARVLDAGETDDGRPYFVMELVRGVPIDEYCDTHKLTTAQRLELFTRVCEAVHHAHQKGVVHRDLKPSNILVTVEDQTPLPKVIDFGIAKAVGASLSSERHVTTMGQMLGTPTYMSPEQAERSGLDVDTRTDVYSLGVMLYEILSGTLPFDRDTLNKPDFVVQYLLREKHVPTPSARLGDLADTQKTVARNRRTDVRTLRRELRGDLDWIVMRAMEKDRTLRYAAASELAADLRRFLDGEPVLARPPSAGYRLRKLARRHRGAMAAAVAVLLAVSVGAVASTVGFLRAARSAEEATAAAQRAEAVNDFLRRMLQAADPVEGEGPATPIAEVLDAASEEVASGALGDRPLVEASVRRAIGGSYLQLGLYDQAREHLERARVLVEEPGAGEPMERVAILRELGQATRRGGAPQEAEALYRQALTVADSAGFSTDAGAGEELTNGVRNDLGLVLRSLDRIDEAVTVLEALVASERRLRDPGDLDLATTLNNLALVKRSQGDIESAIQLFHETLGSLRAGLGPSHLYIAAVMESMGTLEQLQGRHARADSLMREAQAMRADIVGPRHPDYLNGLNNRSLVLMEMGDLDGAAALLEEALETGTDVLGADHPRVANTLHSMGLVHLRREDGAAAEDVFRRVLASREANLGANHRNTLNARSSLAGALLLQDRAREAEEMARQVVTAYQAAGLGDPVLTNSARRTLGRAWAALERFPEAEELLLGVYDLQAEELGPEHPQTRATVDAIVALYGAWGRDDAAQEWSGR